MGYSQCGIRGCESRPGQGLVFKTFPSNKPNLARQWLEVLPSNFKIPPNSAVCELHFELSQHEPLRVDGKKKLKGSAVPRLHLNPKKEKENKENSTQECKVRSPRKPLGDVSNISNAAVGEKKQTSSKGFCPVSHDHSYVGKRHKSNENTPPKEDFLDSCIFALSSNYVEKNEPDPLLLKSGSTHLVSQSGDEGSSALAGEIPSDPLQVLHESSSASTEETEQDQALDLSLPTRCRRASPSPSSNTLATNHIVPSESDLEKNGPFVCVSDLTRKNVKELIKDQEAEIFRLKAATFQAASDKTILDSTIKSQAESEAQAPKETLFKDLNLMTKSNVTDLISSQQRQIKQLQIMLQESTRKTAVLSKSLLHTQSLQRRLTAAQKSQRKLKTIVNSKFSSPWLHGSQRKLLLRKNGRGTKWEPELVAKGLIMKVKCGTTGYSAFVKDYPILPSVRSLQESVQFIRFESGMLHEVFDLLEVFAKNCPEQERDCHIVLDEMAIEEGEKYCTSTKTFIGKATFPTHTGVASKALVIMLSGLQRRWKVAVSVYFTNKRGDEFKKKKGQKDENRTGEAFAEILKEVIKKAESINLRVSGITSDMGPDNLAMWKAFGITGGKKEEMKCSFPNPSRPGAEVFVLPDPVHLFKSIKSALESNGTLVLPPEIVKEANLPSSTVDYSHIDDLYNFEVDQELKLAFRLKPENIHCKKQFATMNVGTSKAVVCHRTGVGLKWLARQKKDEKYLTTAWFILELNTFFQLVTCRGGALALSRSNEESYQKAISIIKRMGYIFQHCHIGKRAEWKPCQRGMRVLCASLLGLQQHFLVDEGWKFLLLGRFTQDCLENLFSAIRLRQPTPHAVAFLQCLKAITLAQYSVAVKGASYSYENCESVSGLDFVAEARRRALERQQERIMASVEELFANPIERVTYSGAKIFPELEECVIYDMAGSVVASLKRQNYTLCDKCLDAVKMKGEEKHPRSLVTYMKEFTSIRSNTQRLLQVYVTDEVFRATLLAEVTFRKHRHATLQFKDTDVLQYFVQNLLYVWEGTSVPKCHNIGKRFLEEYLLIRIKEFGKKQMAGIRNEKTENKVINLSSKSVAKKDAASLITKRSSVNKQ